MKESAGASLPLTLEFTPVAARLHEQKPFVRLHAFDCAGTRLQPGVNEK